MSDCSRLITLSRRIEPLGGGSEIECLSECECDGARLITVMQRVRMPLTSRWCDELGAEIPDGSTFEAEITHHLRLPGPCGGWYGYHDGTFQITGGSVELVNGRIRATHGLDLRLSSTDLCCQDRYAEGVMQATSRGGDGPFDGCRFIGNYRTKQEVGSSSEPCDPQSWLYWEIRLTGMLICSCA